MIVTLIILSGIAFYFGIYRNTKVATHLRRLNNLVADLAAKDVEEGRDWKWRFEEIHKVIDSYFVMVLFFWKPLDSFYKDSPLLKETRDEQ